MYNSKSMKNLNPGIEVIWNGQTFKSMLSLANHLGIARSTLYDRFMRDEEINGHFADYK